jgi:hypothetical protein
MVEGAGTMPGGTISVEDLVGGRNVEACEQAEQPVPRLPPWNR